MVGVLEGELLVIANVGDSRAVMGDNKGSAVPLSFDHKPNQVRILSVSGLRGKLMLKG